MTNIIYYLVSYFDCRLLIFYLGLDKLCSTDDLSGTLPLDNLWIYSVAIMQSSTGSKWRCGEYFM